MNLFSKPSAWAPPGTALITGASSGIGAAFARRLAREGYSLILHGRREELLAGLCRELRAAHPVAADYLLAELAREEDVLRVQERVLTTPDLRLLVNNAGMGTVKFFHEDEVGQHLDLVLVHVLATLRLTHAAIQNMIAHGGGAIINVSSVAAFLVTPGNATYCASKLFLNSFTESLDLELRDRGIRLQALCPGFTTTDFHGRIGMTIHPSLRRHFMSAERVVETSLRDLSRGRVVSIPGRRNRFAAFVARSLPRPVWYALVRRYTAKGRRLRGIVDGED